MKNFSILTEDEYKKICMAIPTEFIIKYFKNNPKEFSKIRPGFRPNGVSVSEAHRLLCINRNKNYISSFVEKIAEKWLIEINEDINIHSGEDYTELVAYTKSLAKSYFHDNISAFLKLQDKEFSEEYICIISEFIKLVEKYDERIHLLTKKNEAYISLENAITSKNIEIEKLLAKKENLTKEIKELKKLDKAQSQRLQKLKKVEDENNTIMEQNKQLSEQIAILKVKMTDIKKESAHLEMEIKAKIKKESDDKILSISFDNVLRPKDISDFIEFLQYNFESIGIKNEDVPVINMLSKYVSGIIFQGRPIICGKSEYAQLTKCISNSLIGTDSLNIIHFVENINEKQLIQGIMSKGRIVVLDNFIGNFNFSLLIDAVSRFKNKIIVLTVTNNKTLCYLTDEIFQYCNYINVSNIPELLYECELTEDPATVDEEEIIQDYQEKNNRYSTILINIMKDLEFSAQSISWIKSRVEEETQLCQELIFNVMPFYTNVLKKNPLNYSENLQRYIAKSEYKSLFERWFF